MLEGGAPLQPTVLWSDIELDGRKVGDLTNCAWSRRLNRNIGFALVSVSAKPGDPVEVRIGGRRVPAALVELPFL